MVKKFKIIRKAKSYEQQKGLLKSLRYLKIGSTIVPKARQAAEGEGEYDINFDVIPKRL